MEAAIKAWRVTVGVKVMPFGDSFVTPTDADPRSALLRAARTCCMRAAQSTNRYEVLSSWCGLIPSTVVHERSRSEIRIRIDVTELQGAARVSWVLVHSAPCHDGMWEWERFNFDRPFCLCFVRTLRRRDKRKRYLHRSTNRSWDVSGGRTKRS